MTIFQDPDSLQNLSFQAFANYLRALCEDFIDREETRPQEVQATCQKIKDHLYARVPPILANQVTNDLLKTMELTFKRMRLKSGVESVLLYFIGAIIHPDMPRLDLCPDDHSEFNICMCFHSIVPLVCQRLDSARKLKALRLCHRDSLALPFISMQGLEEFTYRGGCNDEMLEVLSRTCKQLRKLDIKSSNVTDKSVQTILRLRKLTHLQVRATRISGNGLAELLKGLAEREVRLQSFGCTELTDGHLDELLRMTHLRSLHANFASNCNLGRLRELKFLQSVTAEDLDAFKLHSLLEAVSSQLQQLHFSCLDDIFLTTRFTEAGFRTLCHLHINSTFRDGKYFDISTPESVLSAVECLHLQIPFNTEHVTMLIAKCPNVKILTILNMELFGSSRNIVDSFVRDLPLLRLEKLIWYHGNLTRSTARRLVEHCPKLTVLVSEYVWKRCGSSKQLLNTVKHFNSDAVAL